MLKILKEKYKVDINNYEIIKKISQGGFGIIYLVRNKLSKEDLVAKVNLINTGDSKRQNQFIKREIMILMRVQHQTIIPLRGFSFTDFNGNDNITILMDYMKEGSVSSLIDKEQKGQCSFDYDNTKRQIILAGIARGMMILHDLNIIHRDLSSGNVLLDENYHPLITDFGLSKFFDPQHSKSQSMAETGTLVYMAPEVIEGDHYNTKADVYSFGILMYEIITGTRAYSNMLKKMNSFKLKMQIVNGLRPDLDVPMKEGLKELIQSCLSKSPDDRPTFSEIFGKLSLSYSDELLSDEDEIKYCLDDVDLDEFLDYIEEITETDNNRIATILNNLEMSHKSEIKSLEKRIKDQEAEIKSLKEKISSQESELSRMKALSPKSGVANSIGNLFYAQIDQKDPGIFCILKTKEKNQFDHLFIASQSTRDIYQLINPNTQTFFGTSSESPNFFIDFLFEKSIRFNGIVVYSRNSFFPRSFDIFVDKKLVKSVKDAGKLNSAYQSMVVTFPETSGTCVSFKQTSQSWEGKNALFIKRIELLSPESKYSKGVFTKLIEESESKDPHKCNVLISASSFDLNSFHLVNNSSKIFCESKKVDLWFQVELTRGSAIITGFRIVKRELKSYKVIASDDVNKPIDSWIKLFEVSETENRNSRTCDVFELPHPSPLVRFVRLVLTGPNWKGNISFKIRHFDIFGYYF